MKRKEEWESHKTALDIMKEVRESNINNQIRKKG